MGDDKTTGNGASAFPGFDPKSAEAYLIKDPEALTVNLARSLEAVSPLATIARGYAILRKEDGRIVRSVGDASEGERLSARLQDGILGLRVEDTAG